jgi:hypothetical protein
MSESIFCPPSTRIVRWPAAYPRQPAAPRTCAATIHTASTIATSHDARLLAILEAPLADGEPAYIGFARKERELGEAFAALPIFDQRALYGRLASPKPADRLAETFARLLPERRTRLLNFLGDARRRAALAKVGR